MLRVRRARGLAWILAVGFVFAGSTEAWLTVVRARTILKNIGQAPGVGKAAPKLPRRGPILASDGTRLAEDLPLSRLTLNFGRVPKVPGFFADLAVAIGLPESQLEAASRIKLKKGQSLQWDLPLTNEQEDAVQAVRTRWNAAGLGVDNSFGRSYPLGSMVAGIVGWLPDGDKPEGLEGSFDTELKGQKAADSEAKPTDGVPVETTIDPGLQVAASQAIREAVESHHADRGAAVILDPRSGDILAVANWPSYEPKKVAGAAPLPQSSHLDLAYMGRIEPGSMMKVLTLALSIDLFGMPPAVQCAGQIEVAGHLIRCDDHAGQRAHGSILPDRAISQSCNVSAATWGMRIKVGPFYQFLTKLGLLDPTGLNLPKEIKGFALEDPPAPVLEAANWGFGQSVTVTPLALADALSCLANNGNRMKLRLVARVGDKVIPPVSAGQMVSAQSANTVLRYMEGVFSDAHGTGHELRIPGYRLAGKTGTAQIANKGGQYVANFVGFLPADKPVAEILVMVERPRTGSYYGAQVAGPAFVSLARAVIRRYGLAPTEPIVETPKDSSHQKTVRKGA